jgi:eukaryotic-like serine/threonine-protein kinase
LIGSTLDNRYRIEAVIGSGGMSTVYLAFDETLERNVAVKVMHSEISRDPSAIERFRREARSAARLSHPNVVMVIDAGEGEGHPYIVFEHVKGETLKSRIKRSGALPVSEAVAFAIEIGRALDAAHQHQIVHRDVKPQNVLIDEEGAVKVSDFGIARSLELSAQPLTAAGRVVGTTDYVSPEQALGQEVTGQSDVYSLGIVLYEMLTGETPFKSETSVGVAMKHVREGLPDVQKRRPEISAALAAVVERATAKQVENRYGSIGEMVEELESALEYEAARSGDASGQATAVLRDLSPGAPPERRSWALPRGRVLRLGLYSLAVIAAAALAGVLIERETGKSETSAGPSELSAIKLGDRDATDYDPAPGDGQENGDQTSFVLDGDRTTAWETERYDTAELGSIKDGVGLYLDAGRAVVARSLRISSPVEGWDFELYVANDVPATIADWTKVGSGTLDSTRQTASLDTGSQRFRYFLVWITKLAPRESGGFGAAISELHLFG